MSWRGLVRELRVVLTKGKRGRQALWGCSWTKMCSHSVARSRGIGHSMGLVVHINCTILLMRQGFIKRLHYSTKTLLKKSANNQYFVNEGTLESPVISCAKVQSDSILRKVYGVGQIGTRKEICLTLSPWKEWLQHNPNKTKRVMRAKSEAEAAKYLTKTQILWCFDTFSAVKNCSVLQSTGKCQKFKPTAFVVLHKVQNLNTYRT